MQSLIYHVQAHYLTLTRVVLTKLTATPAAYHYRLGPTYAQHPADRVCRDGLCSVANPYRFAANLSGLQGWPMQRGKPYAQHPADRFRPAESHTHKRYKVSLPQGPAANHYRFSCTHHTAKISKEKYYEIYTFKIKTHGLLPALTCR